jgi:plastocyanin
MVRTPLRALVASSVVLLVASCGSGGSYFGSSSGPTTPAATTPSATPLAVASTPVTATESEFHITLSLKKFTAATYTFHIVNSGGTSHALEIQGPGLAADARSALVSPGASGSLTVTLSKGTYDVYCPVGNHKDMGMETSITVA